MKCRFCDREADILVMGEKVCCVHISKKVKEHNYNRSEKFRFDLERFLLKINQ